MKKSVLSLLLFSLLVIGCGRNPDVQVEDGIRIDIMPDQRQIEAAQNGYLKCDDPNECNPALALISIATPQGLARCSGFLISENRVVTNDHCVDFPHLEQHCDQYAFIYFNGDVRRTCSKVLFRSRTSGSGSKDYAIIELDHPVLDRKPLRLSNRGFFNHEKATIYRVQMTEDSQSLSYGGVQSKKSCQASYSTMLTMNINDSLAPVMSFGDCPVQKGNSGSPILNANGQVGAILQSYLSLNSDEISNQLKPFLLDETYGDIMLGTQIRCIPALVGSEIAQCKEESKLLALYPEPFLKSQKFDPQLLPTLKGGDDWREYQLLNSEPFVRHYVTVPNCLTAKEVQNDSFSFYAKLLNFRLGITRFLQASWRAAGILGDRQTRFRFVKKNPPVSASLKEVEMVSADAGSIKIPICRK